MGSRTFITGYDPVQETIECVERLGGRSIVKAVILTTQPNCRPLPIESSSHWPIVIEVAPKPKSLRALTQIRVQNVRVGITNADELQMKLGKSELDADALLKALEFDIPDLFYRTFCGDRFEKTALVSSSA